MIPCNSTNYQTGRAQKIQFIVVHYTANDGDSARGNCVYFQRNPGLYASAHYFVDETGWGRTRCSVLMFVIMLVVGSASALGFGVWSFVAPFGMSILDFFDFLTNSVMMPIAAFCTCFLIVKVVGVNRIVEHVRISSAFKRERLFDFMIRYVAPICVIIILISSVANVLGIIHM